MRLFLAASMVLVLLGRTYAEEPATAPSDVAATIDLGLAFLAKDALTWKSEHNCVSCHHAALFVWSMREAQQRGFEVDEPVLEELTKWIAESGDGKTSQPRPEAVPNALNEKAVYFAPALTASPSPDAAAKDGLKQLLQTVKEDQSEGGSWRSWPETRPPLFGHSDERATALALLALLPAAEAGDDDAIAARDKAEKWFVDTPTDGDPQSLALRTVVWQRLGRPTEELESLVQRIKAAQNSDGGWSQTTDLASDAWATGQALYALAGAGLASDDPVIRRGQEFLTKTQQEDGSWPMTSRPIEPGGEGSEYLVPITGAGSAWAVLGLVRSR